MITTATKITIARLVLIPAFILTAFIEFPYHILVAGLIYSVTAITDILDGAIARKTNTISKLGKVLDPIADKALQVSGLIYAIVYGMYYFPILAIVMTCVIFAREIAVIVMRGIVLKQGLTLTPDIFGKLKTIFLNVSLPVIMLSASLLAEFGYNDLRYDFFKWLATVLFFIAFALTLISALRYFYVNRRTFKTACENLKKNRKKGAESNGVQ